MTKTIATKTNSRGHKVRIQERRGRFDVIYNSNGYAWHYVLRGASEQEARNEFYLQSL